MKKTVTSLVTSGNEGFLLALIQKQGFLAPVVSPRRGFWDLEKKNQIFFGPFFWCSTLLACIGPSILAIFGVRFSPFSIVYIF